MSHCGTAVRWGTQQPGISRGHRRRLPTAGTENITTHCPAHPQLVTASPLRSYPGCLRACCPGNQNATVLLPISLPQVPVKALEPHPPHPKVILCSQEGAGPWACLAQGEQSKNQGLWAPTKNTASSTCLSTPGYLLKSFLSSACSVGRATEAQSSYVNCPFLYR